MTIHPVTARMAQLQNSSPCAENEFSDLENAGQELDSIILELIDTLNTMKSLRENTGIAGVSTDHGPVIAAKPIAIGGIAVTPGITASSDEAGEGLAALLMA